MVTLVVAISACSTSPVFNSRFKHFATNWLFLFIIFISCTVYIQYPVSPLYLTTLPHGYSELPIDPQLPSIEGIAKLLRRAAPE